MGSVGEVAADLADLRFVFSHVGELSTVSLLGSVGIVARHTSSFRE